MRCDWRWLAVLRLCGDGAPSVQRLLAAAGAAAAALRCSLGAASQQGGPSPAEQESRLGGFPAPALLPPRGSGYALAARISIAAISATLAAGIAFDSEGATAPTAHARSTAGERELDHDARVGAAPHHVWHCLPIPGRVGPRRRHDGSAG